MKQSVVPLGVKTKPKVAKNKPANAQFISLALDMSWRLALVVLVPIVGGNALDTKLKTSPWLLVLGFVLAMVGLGLVMWRTVQVVNRLQTKEIK